MGLLAFRAVGMGLAMMPIMTGGLAVIPQPLVSRASAFNNVVQRCSAALGLAVLTALLTRQQTQQMTDRSALIPRDVTPPTVGPPGTPPLIGQYLMYQELMRRVFVAAIDDLFLVTAAITLVAVALALALRSRLAQWLEHAGVPARDGAEPLRVPLREAQPVPASAPDVQSS
jgi:hypothetical protein